MDIREIVTSGSFDLHLHTTASDGDYSPQKMVEMAHKKGIQTIAITDHDTVNGLEEAVTAGQRLGVNVIRGIELSTKYKGKTVDILGYGITPNDELTDTLKELRDERETRAIKIIDKFNEIGMQITIEDVQKYSHGEVISRPHIAKVIVEKGYVEDYQTVFDQYLADGMPCSIDKKIITPEEAIKLIHHAGGLAVIAHPVFLENEMVIELLEYQFDGIEVWHRKHAEEDIERFKDYANQYNLLMTGGSDFHNDEHEIGEFGFKFFK